MSIKIILAPYSTQLRSGNPNPKNPPDGYWQQVVMKLKVLDCEISQIGGLGEERVVGVDQFIVNWPLKKLRTLTEDADCFVTIDSFLPHFIYAEKINKRGVVVWSLSDPLIWGHPTNINLLRDRKYVRPLQYQDWCSPTYNEDAFISPEEVVDAVITLTQPQNRTSIVPRSLSMAQ